MKYVKLVQHIAPGLVHLRYCDCGQTHINLWAETKSRQHTTCAATEKPIVPGDKVYRPVTNKGHRGSRVLASWVAKQVI